MGARANILKNVLSALPTAVSDFLEKAIPSIITPPTPTDEASSILAMGYAAYNECNVMKQFEGFKPLHLLLRLGMLSNSGIASVLLSSVYDPSGTVYTTFADWAQSFRLPGLSTDTGAVSAEQAIPDTYLAAINEYMEAVGAWYADTSLRISVNEEAYANGLALPYEEVAELPVPIPLPVPIDPSLPPALYFLIWLVKFVSDNNLLPIIKHIAEEILRRLKTGGAVSPLVKLFKKFAFLEKDNPDLGFRDLTSLLRLNADKPIEIIN